jgi:hypothetical protein
MFFIFLNSKSPTTPERKPFAHYSYNQNTTHHTNTKQIPQVFSWGFGCKAVLLCTYYAKSKLSAVCSVDQVAGLTSSMQSESLPVCIATGFNNTAVKSHLAHSSEFPFRGHFVTKKFTPWYSSNCIMGYVYFSRVTRVDIVALRVGVCPQMKGVWRLIVFLWKFGGGGARVGGKLLPGAEGSKG